MEKGHEDDQTAGAPLLGKQAERAGTLSAGEQGDLSVPKWGCKRDGEGLFSRARSVSIRGDGFTLKECSFTLDITGTGCPEVFWKHHPWQCLRPGWVGL